MKLYIAGPMAGYHRFNFDAFDWVAAKLRERGDEVVNPAEFADTEVSNPATAGGTWEVMARSRAEYLRRDFRHLLECDALVLLPGWQDSTGANAELWLARTIDLLVYRWEDDMQTPEGPGGLVYDPEARPSDQKLQAHWDLTIASPIQALFRAAGVDIGDAVVTARGVRSS